MHQFDFAYNSIGELYTLTYPTSTASTRFKLKYEYSNGYLTSIRDFTGDVDNTTFWALNQLNARGQAIDEIYGNGLWLQSHFKPLTGEIDTRQSGTGGSSTNVQNLSYTWDIAGNLKVRQDVRQGINETFDYDALNRMWRTVGPAGTFTVGYDAIGNVTSRSDVNGGSTWTYHATKKNAVTAAGSNTYGYDANGNVQTRNGVAQTWTSANLAATLTSGGLSTQFSYAPDRSRWKQVASYSGGQETTLFIGGMLEKHTTTVPARTHWKHLIATPSGEVQYVRRDNGTTNTFYLPSDHLGSTDAVLGAAGTILVRTSFDAWGKRRDDDWIGAPSSTELAQIAATSRHGFTGHDMLDNIGLVHMNGRVYDPGIGRFMSADPFVVPMLGTQGFNRYAYVGNAPLSYVDPSGFYPIDPNAPDPHDSDNWDLYWPGWDLCFGYCADPGWFITVGDRHQGGPPNGGAGSHGGPVDGNPFNNPRNGGPEAKEEFSASVTADHLNVSTVGEVLTAQARPTQNLQTVVPVFFDPSGNPLSVHMSLADALQAGESAAEAARLASGTTNEYGVATLKGHVTSAGVQTYYNSDPVTSNSQLGIQWNLTGLTDLVALNHYHPSSNGFSAEDQNAYRVLRQTRPDFQGIYMYDGRGNHWYGPSRKVWWIFRSRTHSCGKASSTTWTCSAVGPDWRP